MSRCTRPALVDDSPMKAAWLKTRNAEDPTSQKSSAKGDAILYELRRKRLGSEELAKDIAQEEGPELTIVMAVQ